MDNMSREQVIENIRACVVSSKGGVPLKDINRDYKMIVGQPIPYHKLGHQSLESFLRSLPDLNLRPAGGDLVLEAVPTKDTYHISQMVRGQKSSSRRKSVPSHSGPRQSRFPGKPSMPSRIAPRRAQLPIVKPKQLAGFPGPQPLPSLSKANLPPRLKSLNQQIPNQNVISGQTMLGPRRVKSSYSPEQHLYQAEDITSSLHKPTSPVELLNPVSSILRTPTAVLGPTSPTYDYGMPSSGARVSGFPPSSILPLNYNPVPRTNAQARISRHLPPPAPRDADAKIGPLFNFNPFLTKGIENESSQINSQIRSKSEEKGTNYRSVLDSYCRAKQLPDPVYKLINSFPKSRTKQIVCSIKVGPDHGFSSYPAECKTEDEAIEVAANTTVEELQKVYGEVGESLPITTNENLLTARIAEMLDEHPNGLWSLQVPAFYRGLHHEIVPADWLDILRGSPLITIDRAVHNRIILLPNRAKGSSPTPQLDNLSSKMSVMEVKEEEKVEVNHKSLNGEVISLGQIRLPEDDFWNVYVSYATSTTNVWIRFIGEEYSALYDDMAADMELLYMDGGAKVENLVVGHFYALQVDDCWHRVELIELSEDSNEKATKSATCFFVDNGDDDVFDASQLRKLGACFTKLPCQAVQCHLTGLEDFSSDIVESHLVNSIFGRNLVAKPTAESLEDDGSGRPYPSLTLYDTSTDVNVNLNQTLLDKILNDAIPPTLLKNGKIQEAFVSYVAQTGSLSVQLPSNIFDYIMKAVEEYSSNIAVGDDTLGKVLCGVKTVFPDMVYLAKYKEDMLWYRAIKDITYPGVEDGKVWVKFVDFGNSELISLNEMVALPSSSMLSKLPFQAIACRLHNMAEDTHFTEKGLRRCWEIVPSEEPVLLKVVSTVTDSTSGKTIYDIVEIFKRVQPDNLLASVSTTLSVEEGVFEKAMVESGDGYNELKMNKPIKASKASRRASLPYETGNLSAPKVPKVGELFDVHVTIAANPGNFTVQPWKDAIKFGDMMSAMQLVYSPSSDTRTDGSHLTEEMEKYCQPLKRSDIIEGGVYAALHEDQMWYRINVSKLIEASNPEEALVSAYFVDYGDVAVMTLDKLRQLAPHFFDVPYQAIKAKLAGVSPVHSDWSVEDCLRFQEMVCNKQFVATIVEMGPDLIDPSDTVIGIHLTDTSDPKVDQSIGQIFIDEGRAVAC